jgi:hypothetical protein
LAILLCLVFPAAGGAQEPAAPAPLTEALKAALTASALKRVVGERYFKDTHGDLVTVRCTLDDSKKPAALKCRVEFRAVGAMRRESLTLRCTLGLDGRVRESGFVLIRGRNRTEADGTVGDGTLVFAVRETANSKTESRAVTVPWPADALPYTVAAFVMPLLELPAGQRVRVFHPVSLAVNTKASTLKRPKSGQVTLTDAYPGMNMVVAVKAGVVAEVRLGERVRYTPITNAQAQALGVAPTEPEPGSGPSRR